MVTIWVLKPNPERAVTGSLCRRTGHREQCHAGVRKFFLPLHRVGRGRHEDVAAFTIHERAFSQPRVEVLQRWQQQARFVWRVDECDVPQPVILRQKLEHADLIDGETAVGEKPGVLAQSGRSFVILLDQSRLPCSARLGLKSKRTTAGVEVETKPPLDVAGQPVKEGDTGALQCRPYRAVSRKAELSTLPLPTDNARLVVQFAVP